MKLLTKDILSKNYAEHFALFFTDDGIIVNSQTSSPILRFAETVNQLKLVVNEAYLDDSSLIINCRSTLTPDQMLTERAYINNVKSFLAATNDTVLGQRILRALHWLTWDAKFQYCSKCGGKIQKVLETTEKKCGSCELSFFPNPFPAVMVLIQRENELLLARSAHFKPGIYSALAGFIDIGETAEQAVHREVREEVGVQITELKYFGSQSWPFPNSFMIAFKAEYLRGEIKIDGNEIEDARWFHLNKLPPLPPSSSVSRKLIESVVLKE
ncbi:MAG: NAD(+) diphosphatase [Alphaproteobacteria bacterium]|nr:NAD(+) diphosphatase [Alphaproteobacteria bacterium]